MTHLANHVAAYRAGRITVGNMREACPFTFPPPDSTTVAAMIQARVKSEGHRGSLPNVHKPKPMDADMIRIMDFLRGVSGATSPAIARLIDIPRHHVAASLEKLYMRGAVDRAQSPDRVWVWRIK